MKLVKSKSKAMRLFVKTFKAGDSGVDEASGYEH